MAKSHDELTKGTQVRLVSDPSRTGVIIDDNPLTRRGRRRYLVQFPNIAERISEDDLERLPASRTEPLDLLKGGNLGTPDDLRRALIHVRLTGCLADTINSIEATNTTFYPYQFKSVLKMLQTPANGILIADEVGLGKTIEAGLIWTELRVRFNLNRLFVICPASLCEKWRDELAMKIGVDAEICNMAEAYNKLRDNRSMRRGFALISSMQGLRSSRGSQSEINDSKTSTFHQFLEEMENDDNLIDVLIVDEAHYMRNPATATHHLGRLLRSVSTYVILLSATPVHNHNTDLFSLLRLIDEDMFAQQEYLSEILRANEPLIKARDKLLSGKSQRTEIAKALNRAKQNHLLSGSRQLEILMSQFEESDLTHIPTRVELAYRIEQINLLSHTIARTRKREVLDNRVVREPLAEFVSMAPIEATFYEMVTEIVANYAISQGLNQSFLQVTPQQQMASCMPAALRSWQEKRPLMQPESNDWLVDPNQEYVELGPLISELVVRSKQLCEYQELQKFDTKYKRVTEVLSEFFSKNRGEKIIIFSMFRATISYLSNRLTADGMSTIVLRGGDRVDKYEVLRKFKSPEGPQILLSTEVGGEGIDLQFCWAIINYDLPWNPMRIEQRIGRVDRLGQTSSKVLVWNLLYDNTIDSRIYRRLYQKLDLCRKALGDFEPIVGERIGRITRDLITRRLSPAQQEERIDQTAIAIEEQRAQQERLEGDAASLVAYGEYILKEVHAARDLQRWISGADLQFYVTSCLDMYFPGYKLSSHDASDGEYRLLLSSNARHRLWDFIKRNKLSGKTILNQSVTPVRCKFSNRSLGSVIGNGETISQAHPLVRFAIHRFSQSTNHLCPAVAVRVSSSNVPETFRVGTYLLAVSLWSVQGIRNHEKLAYEVLEVGNSRHLLGNESGEQLVNASVKKGVYWSDADSHCDFSSLHDIANSVLFAELELRYGQFVASEEALNWDRAEILTKNLERRFRRKEAGIRETLIHLYMSGKVKTIPATEGKLKSLRDRFRQQVSKIKEQRKITPQVRDVAIAVVRVE